MSLVNPGYRCLDQVENPGRVGTLIGIEGAGGGLTLTPRRRTSGWRPRLFKRDGRKHDSGLFNDSPKRTGLGKLRKGRRWLCLV